MSKIEIIWDKLFEYWKTFEPSFVGCNAATQKEVLELEKYLKFKLPIDFKESLQRCNAYPLEPTNVIKSSCFMTGGAGTLYTIDEIQTSHQDFKEYMFDGCAYKYIDSKILPKNIVWSNAWIPIYSWNCDELALLDLRENIGEQYGQVLYLDQEYDTLGVWAKSYEEFLKSIADAILDHGVFNHDDMKNVRDRINKETHNT